MPIFVVYQVEDGTPVSVTRSAAGIAEPAKLEARGYAVAERPDEEEGGVWNRAELRFDPRPAGPRMVTKVEFLRRFDPASERIPIREAAKTNPVIADFLAMIDVAEEGIDLNDAEVAAGLDYLVAEALLTDNRPAEILA